MKINIKPIDFDLRKNFRNIIIFILLLVIFFISTCRKTSCPPDVQYINKTKSDTIYKTDTVYKKYTTQITSKPQIVETITPDQLNWEEFDTTGMAEYVMRGCQDINISKDTLKLADIGNVKIIDTLQYNKIIGRRFIPDYKIPTITNTVHITDSIFVVEKKRTQWYLGGGLSGDKLDPFKRVELGILIKNKRDGIFGVKTSLDFNGNIDYGIVKYWKIKLKK